MPINHQRVLDEYLVLVPRTRSTVADNIHIFFIYLFFLPLFMVVDYIFLYLLTNILFTKANDPNFEMFGSFSPPTRTTATNRGMHCFSLRRCKDIYFLAGAGSSSGAADFFLDLQQKQQMNPQDKQ